jgi:ATP-dependent exoDNAse (exonuclease V) beta subunit
MIADAMERQQALDISRSFIVQAPAGSGKTELLIQRLLALLAKTERPQQVLAITFTNKAAAEMRQRLLEALALARDEPQPQEAHRALTWKLADTAYRQHGQSLLDNPAQLSIQTIDSFNAALVRKMPWLSRFGGVPKICTNPGPLYAKAVEQLFYRLDGEDATSRALQTLLRHLDNRLGSAQALLVDMLGKRDQWLRYLADRQSIDRERLQQNLIELCELRLRQLVASFPGELAAELCSCANFAAQYHPQQDVAERLAAVTLPLSADFANLPQWQVLAALLLTDKETVRKTISVRNGFPPDKEYKPYKERMKSLLEALESCDSFIAHLAASRKLPVTGYTVDQWQLLEALFEILPLLLVELWQVFRNQGETDFAEIALKAQQALGRAEDPSDLLLRIDNDLRHILVDEFQDTSSLQYRLLDTLIGGWCPGDGRSLFLVGDPMQSIYRFREAEVGLFLRSFGGTFGASHWPLTPLQLKCNFRSQKGIVDWVNNSFAKIFPAQTDGDLGAVSLARATHVNAELPGPACTVYPYRAKDDLAEALQVVEIIRQARAANPQETIAILVRSRSHLKAILPQLHAAGVGYQAQDIDLLGARPAALDLMHLCWALLHRDDRLSWLAVLRAPWCGLTLRDLQLLCDHDPQRTIPALLADFEAQGALSDDGRLRLQRVAAILLDALDQRGRLPLRDLLERSWFALGGASCYAQDGRSDAAQIFTLIADLEQGGELEDFNSLRDGIDRLYARASADGASIQIMTIHKAKGLEFDSVILPGLGKRAGRVETPLLRWQEHPSFDLLLAPAAARGGDRDPIYQLIAALEQEKGALEDARLLYVAATRAVKRLHLLGHAGTTKSGELSVTSGSLLEKLKPIVEPDFLLAPNASEEVVADMSVATRLKRLPSDWSLPAATALDLPQRVEERAASDHEPQREQIFSGWETPVHRHVGTLVHWQLELLALRGLEHWTEQQDAERRGRLKQILSSYGTPRDELDAGVEKVCRALEQILESERGRWILAAHRDHQCELPVSGVVEGQLVHAVIDRIFFDDAGCWVIDYKNSMPGQGETLEAFLVREASRYRAQLQTYAQLVAQRYPATSVKAALYFPLVDGWYEFSDFSAKGEQSSRA